MGNNKEILWPGWETVRELGRGSFGAVYEIQRQVFEDVERAAVKKITIPNSQSDIQYLIDSGLDSASVTETIRSYVEDVVKEYSLMRKMNGSANVVSCDDFRMVQHENGIGWDIYIKMELLTPLSKVLPREIPEDQVIAVAKDMCKALILCKEHNIIHRDIKPQNIFLSDNGDYKLGDFGIAKTIERTSGGTKTGTYNYMAPEINNKQNYNLTADIYSLGLVLYWMLNERRGPFVPLPPTPLKSSTLNEALDQRFSGKKIPPPAHGSEALKEIVLKACAYDPSERYSAAVEMKNDLEQLQSIKEVTSTRHVDREKTVSGSFYTIAENTDDTKTITGNGTNAVNSNSQKHGRKTEPPKKLRGIGFYIAGVALLLGVMGFFGIHIWEDADCTQPRHCRICGKSDGEARGHSWLEATCIEAARCAICGETSGEAAGHDWDLATCTHEATCKKCGAEDGKPLEHSWRAATCTEPKTCVLCGLAEESALGHNWEMRGIFQICSRCGISGSRGQLNQTFDAGVAITADGAVVTSLKYDLSGWHDIVAVSSDNHVLGLKKDGTVIAAGNNDNGQCNVSDWQNIIAVAAGRGYSAGLHADGTVVVTDQNNPGQFDVSEWRDIVAISCGYGHIVGLHADGSVVAVGSNDYGQCDVSEWRDIVSIAAGALHTLGLRKDGTVVAVGDNRFGLCNVSGWHDIVAIGAGNIDSMGLQEDGTVVGVGENLRLWPEENGMVDIVALSSGICGTPAGIKLDGTVVNQWGDEIFKEKVALPTPY